MLFIATDAAKNVNLACGENFEMELALMFDANLTKSEFREQKLFFYRFLDWLPDIGKSNRVSIVPYSWTAYNPVMRLSANASQKRSKNTLRFF